MPGEKRPSDDEQLAANSKRRSVASQSRTGQACDRCKSRKIRCDSSENGCMPCRQNNTECTTTDRVTNRVFVRGHTENLERHCDFLKLQITALQEQLKSHGIEPTLDVASSPSEPILSTSAVDSTPSALERPASKEASDTQVPLRVATDQTSTSSIFTLPSFRDRAYGDNYLGVSSSPATVLSQIRGTSVTIFNREIDLLDYLPADYDSEDNPTSYKFFFNNAYRVGPGYNPPHRPPFPSKAEHVELAKDYLLRVNPWVPVLHKPEFMRLVERIHDDPTFEPTIAEEVFLHTTLGYSKYLQASHCKGPARLAAATEAFKRYRYSLHKLPDLYGNRTLADVQALTLIIAFVRMFPRPGPIWIMANCAFLLCIEMGLHRSTKAWPDDTKMNDPHVNEMRKRVFWTMFMLVVNVSTRLGRPVCLRSTDYDTELPDPTDDRLPEERDDPNVPLCSWAPLRAMFKLAEIFLDTYDWVYTVRPTTQAEYEARVTALASRFDDWKKSELTLNRTGAQASKDPMSRTWELRTQLWGAEYQILLHHPALCRTSNPNFLSHLTDVCMDASSDLIRAMSELRAEDRIDRSWTTAVTFIGAIGAQLFCHWQLRTRRTPACDETLIRHMSDAVEVLREVGDLLGDGAGTTIGDYVESIIKDVLVHLQPKNTPKKSTKPATSNRKPRVSPSILSSGAYTSSRPSSSSSPSSQVKIEPYHTPVGHHAEQEKTKDVRFADGTNQQYTQANDQYVQQQQPPASMPHSHSSQPYVEYPENYHLNHMHNQPMYTHDSSQGLYATTSNPMSHLSNQMSGPVAWQQFVDTFSDPYTSNAYPKTDYIPTPTMTYGTITPQTMRATPSDGRRTGESNDGSMAPMSGISHQDTRVADNSQAWSDMSSSFGGRY